MAQLVLNLHCAAVQVCGKVVQAAPGRGVHNGTVAYSSQPCSCGQRVTRPYDVKPTGKTQEKKIGAGSKAHAPAQLSRQVVADSMPLSPRFMLSRI